MSELDEWDKEHLRAAEHLLKVIIRDCYNNPHTIPFEYLLKGMIDSTANHNRNGEPEQAIEQYKLIIQFCSDRIYKLGKQRKAVKVLKDTASQYSSRSQYIKDVALSRMEDHLSVGNHPFNSLQNEPPIYPHIKSEDQLKAIEEAFSYYSSENLRATQRKLTSYANGIEKELLSSRLQSVLSKQEKAQITDSVATIKNLKQTVELANERKARKERHSKLQREDRESKINKAITTYFGSAMKDKANTLSLALFFAQNNRRDMHDVGMIKEYGRSYVDTSKIWLFSWVEDNVRENGALIMERACFKSTGAYETTQIKNIDQAGAELFEEWQDKHEGIVQLNKKLFDDLKTKQQVDQMKANLSSEAGE